MIKYYDETKDVAIANGAAVSAAFYKEQWVSFIGVLFPAMDDGNIGLEMSLNGTDYYPVLDPTDGADAVLCASGSDPGFVDFSDLVRFVPNEVYLRFTCASQVGGARTLKVFKRG